MTDAVPVSAEALTAIRGQLLRRARWDRIPDPDVDDVVDRALWKAARENLTADTPDFASRAHVALHDEVVEFFRRAAARPVIDYDAELPEASQPPVAQNRIEFQELTARLRAELGDEALEYALLVTAGFSEAEIAQRPGWDSRRAGRVRKRLARARLQTLMSDLIEPQQQKETS